MNEVQFNIGFLDALIQQIELGFFLPIFWNAPLLKFIKNMTKLCQIFLVEITKPSLWVNSG